jgi:hypothetical protein
MDCVYLPESHNVNGVLVLITFAEANILFR